MINLIEKMSRKKRVCSFVIAKREEEERKKEKEERKSEAHETVRGKTQGFIVLLIITSGKVFSAR